MPIEQLPPSNFDLKIIPDAAAQIRTATDMGLVSIESNTQITQTVEFDRIDSLALADLSSTWPVLRAEGDQNNITYPQKSADLFRRKDITTTIAYSSILPTSRKEVTVTNGKRVTETVPGFSMLVRSIDDEALLEVVDLPDTVVWNNQSCTAEYNSQTDQVVYVDSQGTIQVVADGRVYRTPTGEIVSLTPKNGDYSNISYNMLGTGGETDQEPSLSSDVITQTTDTDSIQLLTARGGTAMNIILPSELVDRFPKSLFSMDLSAIGDADGNIQIGSTLPGFLRTLGTISTDGIFAYEVRRVTTQVLNVRSEPNTKGTPLGQVAGGTELPVLGTSADGKWVLVAWKPSDGKVTEAWTAEGTQFSQPKTIEYKPQIPEPTSAPVAPTPIATPVPPTATPHLPVQVENGGGLVEEAKFNIENIMSSPVVTEFLGGNLPLKSELRVDGNGARVDIGASISTKDPVNGDISVLQVVYLGEFTNSDGTYILAGTTDANGSRLVVPIQATFGTEAPLNKVVVSKEPGVLKHMQTSLPGVSFLESTALVENLTNDLGKPIVLQISERLVIPTGTPADRIAQMNQYKWQTRVARNNELLTDPISVSLAVGQPYDLSNSPWSALIQH